MNNFGRLLRGLPTDRGWHVRTLPAVLRAGTALQNAGVRKMHYAETAIAAALTGQPQWFTHSILIEWVQNRRVRRGGCWRLYRPTS